MSHSPQSKCYGHTKRNFDEAIRAALLLEGKRFSPLLTARLRDKVIVEKLRQRFVSARLEAYGQLYEAENCAPL